MSDLLLVTAVDSENPVLGDLRLVDGDLLQTRDLSEEVAQLARVRLRFFLGEWFLDLDQGVPYFREVLRKNPDTRVVRSVLRRVLQTTPGVDSVRELSVEVGPDRVAEVQWAAVLKDGTVLRSSDFGPFLVQP